MRTKLRVLNEETGELETRDFVEDQPRKQRNKDFYFMRKVGAELLAEAGLAAAEYRLIWALIAKCEWANKVQIVRKDIETAYGLNSSAMSRSLRKLEQCGALARSASDANCIYLNPMICWRGEPDAVWSAHSRFLEGRRAGVLPAETGNLFGEGEVQLAASATHLKGK